MTTPISRARAKLRAVYRFQHAARLREEDDNAENGQVMRHPCLSRAAASSWRMQPLGSSSPESAPGSRNHGPGRLAKRGGTWHARQLCILLHGPHACGLDTCRGVSRERQAVSGLLSLLACAPLLVLFEVRCASNRPAGGWCPSFIARGGSPRPRPSGLNRAGGAAGGAGRSASRLGLVRRRCREPGCGPGDCRQLRF